jgi:FkbM family methyltransferase
MHKERLKNIHNQLQIRYGSFQEELPEQLMVAKYLTGSESVLEIGGNIGRNSLVIAHILNSTGNTNFVSIECDVNVADMLKENRELNGLRFFIETRALSKRKLAQKGWRTIVCDNCPSDHVKVNTITVHELRAKYNIKFDTLILDCEGAFYYILKDMPEILDGIIMIIMENDYFDISNKREIDKILSDKGFRVEYWENGGWGPCYYNFYELD